MSSMYQLQGNSTNVLAVGVDGVGRGFIQVEAGRWGEKSMGWMGGA
jgi:hypothetical protein